MEKFRSCRIRRYLDFRSGELIHHHLRSFHRLGRGPVMNFLRQHQLRSGENRLRREQLRLDRFGSIDRNVLRLHGRKRNQRGDAVLLQRKSIRKKRTQIDQQKRRQHHECVAGAQGALIDLALRENSELKAGLFRRHEIKLQGDPSRGSDRDWRFHDRRKGTGGKRVHGS